MRFGRRTIPVFLSIDVEPDRFQVSAGQTEPWRGYAQTYEFFASLRARIDEASGSRPRFGWYFRTDPQIEQVFGRADFAMAAYPGRVAALREDGDYFGVHPHPLRWSEERRLWIHDFRDRQWLRYSTQFALDAFSAWHGSPAKLFRHGARFLSDDVVEVLDTNGVAAELSLEPIKKPAVRTPNIGTQLDDSPRVGEYPNCEAAPRTPYHPCYADFRTPGTSAARPILLIPLSTGTGAIPPRGLVPWVKRRFRRGPQPKRMRMLSPGAGWDAGFWNVVTHELGSMERPYLSFAIRTDPSDTSNQVRMFQVMLELTRHPIVERLRFVNPLDVTDDITPRRPVEANDPVTTH